MSHREQLETLALGLRGSRIPETATCLCPLRVLCPREASAEEGVGGPSRGQRGDCPSGSAGPTQEEQATVGWRMVTTCGSRRLVFRHQGPRRPRIPGPLCVMERAGLPDPRQPPGSPQAAGPPHGFWTFPDTAHAGRALSHRRGRAAQRSRRGHLGQRLLKRMRSNDVYCPHTALWQP